VRIAGSLHSFLADPIGRYLVDRSFICFYPVAELSGFCLWGRPDRDDIDRLIQTMALEEQPDVQPHASLIDVRGLETVDPNAFARFSEYVQSHMTRYAAVITCQVLVRSGGLAGAMTAGFFELVRSGYPTHVVSDLSEAFAWLKTPPAIARELEQLLNHQQTLVDNLHQLLLQRPELSLEAAARHFSLSVRTLQRRLLDERTSFVRELHRARVAAAQSLMRDTRRKLSAIALDVGYPSQQQFTRWFRRLTGESPAEWRERQ